ncbi:MULTISPECIES: antitoxin VbhA family protein [Pseudomonas]|uniref:Plasmid-related protein n=2 Tax=Pseudomonas syringae group TaxID=136849 RepID=A0A3M4PLI2_PSEVI|nr:MULTISPECIES: antitoxin VbhA family protein [Pseudomonas]KTB69953.1 hypothetical protein AO068_15235 [Pseudomonas sp. ICMP 3272]KTC51787.1 hypothetical protein AO258_16025 [Pseudomonas syringae ICMP 19498]RMP12061.1 Plasmid-related protein [Pseudomonas syringae pv. persicae]RMQ10076.1 Plasmid-related protein [Pseudomonas viridiflava]RMQ79058.1 Plasmid-related protein [Pseudomonas viridiflava]
MDAIPKNLVISEVERIRRQDAVNYARASFALEGFTPSADDKRHEQRFIEGDIGLAEFVNAVT